MKPNVDPPESWLPGIDWRIAWLVDRHFYRGAVDLRWAEVSRWTVDEGVPVTCRVCPGPDPAQVTLRRYGLVEPAGIYLGQCLGCHTIYWVIDPVKR